MKSSNIGKSWNSTGINKWRNQKDDHTHKYSNRVPLAQKKVSFSFEETYKAHRDIYEESEDPRNLGISRSLQRQFNHKPSTRFFPDIIAGSETQSSYMYPGIQAPIPLPPRNPKVHYISETPDRYSNFDYAFQADPHKSDRKLQAFGKIRELKSRILAGENVPMEEIKAARKNATFRPTDPKWMFIDEPIETRRPKRKRIFCDDGIVKVPTPHNPRTRYNSFGSPADLRISLSNTDTPEFQDRRRYFFDFTGYLDKDIKLVLEDNRRLIIKGNRPSRHTKRAESIEEAIYLPKDLPVDNLRIVRDMFGTLIVEEAWKFI